jgi:hypothetical protein
MPARRWSAVVRMPPSGPGYVADGHRQLVWNPEFCEPAVKRLAEVSDSLFWTLPLAVSTAARQRRGSGVRRPS